MCDLGIIVDGAVLIDGDRIDEVGPTRRLENLAKARNARVIDATGKIVLPGLIDAHTRLLPNHSAVVDPEYSVDNTSFGLDMKRALRRSRSARTLRIASHRWTRQMASCGTTTAEIRVSGKPDSLRRGLRAAAALSEEPLKTMPVVSVSEYLDPETSATDTLEPTETTLKWASNARAAYACELHCGRGALSREQTLLVAKLANDLGFRTKLLLAEADPSELPELLRLIQPLSVDVVSSLPSESIRALGASASLVTLLPGGVHHMNTTYPQARSLIDQGAGICLATAFGSEIGPSLSLPMMMALACRRMRMTPAEAIVACTLNAAAAIASDAELGSIEPGKLADIAFFDVVDYRQLPFFLGFNLCSRTIRRGKIIYQAPPVRPTLSGSTR